MITLGLVSGLLLAPSAMAFSDGQTGLTGRIAGESCLKCHGTDQYAGTTVEIAGAEMGNCVTQDSMFQLPILTAGSTVTVSVSVAEPGADEAACPTNNCCDAANAPAAGDICLTLNQEDNITCEVDSFESCCQTNLSSCPDGKSAGFNIEAVDSSCASEDDCAGIGAFEANQDEGVRLGRALAEPVVTEATHVAAKLFDGGAVTWNIDYTVPNQTVEGVSFWTGVNVANGNFLADVGDLNSNFRLDAFVTDGETITAPGFCAVCPNGALPDESGACPACMCVGAGSNSLPIGLAGLALLGLAVGRRRRRR